MLTGSQFLQGFGLAKQEALQFVAAGHAQQGGLRLGFHAYRNQGIFFEAVTNKICDDLGKALQPRSLAIISNWKARGGFSSRVTAEWKPGKKRS